MMKLTLFYFALLTFILTGSSCRQKTGQCVVTGELKKWQVRFVPDQEGRWEYIVSFRKEESIAISDDPNTGEPAGFDGLEGSFIIGPTDKEGRDLRAKGKLRYIGERYRFDCSKLDQWEIVFSHMDKLGIMLHIVTQETENETLLDNGDTGIQRKLYYRELIARFSHHLAVTWNMGEENGPDNFTSGGQSIEQQKAMTRYMKEHDPYENFVVIHTHSNPRSRYRIFDQLTGYAYLDGPSIQVGNLMNAHEETLVWLEKSSNAGRQWVVNVDEIGPSSRGVDPDDRQPNNLDSVRRYVLWANMMAGGGGVEWYFGYDNHDNDLNCEDWRSRDHLWDQTRNALEFFHHYLPFQEMVSMDTLTTSETDYCLARPGYIYAIYLPDGETTDLNLSDNHEQFTVKWFNPRAGGEMIRGSVTEIKGGTVVSLGDPPEHSEKDWAVLIKRIN